MQLSSTCHGQTRQTLGWEPGRRRWVYARETRTTYSCTHCCAPLYAMPCSRSRHGIGNQHRCSLQFKGAVPHPNFIPPPNAVATTASQKWITRPSRNNGARWRTGMEFVSAGTCFPAPEWYVELALLSASPNRHRTRRPLVSRTTAVDMDFAPDCAPWAVALDAGTGVREKFGVVEEP